MLNWGTLPLTNLQLPEEHPRRGALRDGPRHTTLNGLSGREGLCRAPDARQFGFAGGSVADRSQSKAYRL